MKLSVVTVLLLASTTSAAINGGGRHTLRMGKSRTTVLPEDAANCVRFTKTFLKRPEIPERAIEAAVDHCAVSLQRDARNFVCPHLREGLTNALQHVPAGKALTAEEFCGIAEEFMIEVRGASRVANVGSGALVGFHVSPSCEPTVTKAFATNATSAPASKVPELWYMLCMNQDCGHLLPSRTRWCQTVHQPTQSAAVCEAARKFMIDGTTALSQAELNASEICGLYADFVKEMGHDVESYEHVVHFDTHQRVPSPDDAVRALGSSQLVNDAGGHYIRDNAGSIPAHSAAATDAAGQPIVAVAAAFLSVLALPVL